MSGVRRELVATINGRPVGRLFETMNLWSFEYAGEWIESGFDLSPHMRRAQGRIDDGASQRPVQWFFDNLLPEEQARELLAKEAEIPGTDAFALLAYYGRESAGAITLRAPGEAAGPSGLEPLTDADLSERIAKLPKQSLAAGAPKKMSNAGAQHKLSVCLREGALYLPVGETPSTHLLKPDHVDRDEYPGSAANEYFVMRLAAQMGLPVPPVQIRFVPQPVYLVERFDRVTCGDETTRLHIIDACQLLNLDRTFKYQQATAGTLMKIIDHCSNRARARQDLAAWVLFNVLTGNGDAHLKNLSFHVDTNGVQLAPFYDLVSTECWRAAIGNEPRWPHRDLGTRIGQAETFGQISLEQYLTFADALGVTRTAANRLVKQLAGGIETAAKQLYEEFERLAMPAEARAGQLQVLRAIRAIVIREMVPKLSG
jgi:serine/threonine-protein kinase HipA